MLAMLLLFGAGCHGLMPLTMGAHQRRTSHRHRTQVIARNLIIHPQGTTLGRPITAHAMISSGFSFSDGEQVLVSAQKPLGIVLGQEDCPGPIVVAEIDGSGSAARAGVRREDVLVAVQNASVENASLDEVLSFIGGCPKVVNLRFVRKD
ncbi:hypothetical protein THAOC_01844 [Thalassiosira oceanica]|uniref:PDZ domain-containing protein n=1 Tax=Thalassiosira oceanica TaxID=159749 RepID=K0TQP3_THAOC|nr:hypothetical protein THAOC_01844 [Thalassiosira oceanica]|eukprot:EJK76397.1 hypothetical protein THAOC_01844 [Thalassiosira oceanica]